MVSVQTKRAHPQLAPHGAIPAALRETKVNAARKQGRQKNESLRRGDKPKWLIDIGRKFSGKVGHNHPHQHQSADGIEFQTTAHSGLQLDSRIAVKCACGNY